MMQFPPWLADHPGLVFLIPLACAIALALIEPYTSREDDQ
jgi:hypothetical protein